MTVAVSTLLGRPLWYELMTTDMKGAETFYKNVVGWSASPFEGSPMPYTTFNKSGQVPVAGLMTKPDEVQAPPFWAMYVGVPKIEEAVAHIKRLGGSEMSPVIDIPSVGRMQMVKDPQGAAFYIYLPASDRPAAGEGGRSGRGVVARADDDRRTGRDEVLSGRLWLAAERDDGHGADGEVPHVQPSARDDRRHDEQAARVGERAAQLADLLPRAGHQRRGRAHQSERRADTERPDGGSRWRLGAERDGSAGRRILAARQESAVAFLNATPRQGEEPSPLLPPPMLRVFPAARDHRLAW